MNVSFGKRIQAFAIDSRKGRDSSYIISSMAKRVELTVGETSLLVDILDQFEDGLVASQKDLEADGTLAMDELLLFSATAQRQITMGRILRAKLT